MDQNSDTADGVTVATDRVPHATPHTTPRTKPRPSADTKPKQPPKYNVLLWDDDQHSYEYVIAMMQKVFGHSPGKALRIAFEVDHHGLAVCLTTNLEHAELKCQQIRSFGRDHLIASSLGSMKSTIERVEP